MNIAMFNIIDQWQAKSTASVFQGTILENILTKFNIRQGVVEANYIPCITPVGHATLSTGSNPKDHEIIGRSWWTIETGHQVEVSLQDLSDHLLYGAPSPFRFTNYIKNNNLCHGLKGFFSIVAAAKDFVPLILGGDVADVQIYPWLGPGGWEVNIRCIDQWILSKSISDEIIYNLSNRLKISAKYIGWEPTTRCHRFLLLNFSLLSVNPIKVDAFYSDCVRLFLNEASRRGEQNALSCQSFYSTDWVGHESGPISNDYKKTLKEVFEIIAYQITHSIELSYKDNFIGLITSDHGGRDVEALIKLEPKFRSRLNYAEFEYGPKETGHDKTLFQSTSTSSPDILYWYDVGGSNDINRHGYEEDDHDKFKISSSHWDESFKSHNQPAIIEVADENKYFYSQLFRNVWKGSHGASILDRKKPQDLNPDDYTIPYIFFIRNPSRQNKSFLQDVNPIYHRELREIFFSLIRRSFIVTPSKPQPLPKTTYGGARMLSMHGLSQQCQLMEKAYESIAKAIRLEELSLDSLKNFQKGLSLEIENEELSLISKLLLVYVKIGIIKPDFSSIKDIMVSPSDFKGGLSEGEKAMMDSLGRFSDLHQIIREIKNLKDLLDSSQTKDDVAEAFEITANILHEKVIEIEELLA